MTSRLKTLLSSEAKEHHVQIISKCYKHEELMPNDAHFVPEATCKNGEDRMRGKPFYSSIDWHMHACKKHDSKCEDSKCSY